LSDQLGSADIQTAVFDDLAQEALTTCRRSLTHGSELLGTKKDKAIDGRLFLVRHLLILKEMTAGLQLGRRDRTKDWAGITGMSLSLTRVIANARFPERAP